MVDSNYRKQVKCFTISETDIGSSGYTQRVKNIDYARF